MRLLDGLNWTEKHRLNFGILASVATIYMHAHQGRLQQEIYALHCINSGFAEALSYPQSAFSKRLTGQKHRNTHSEMIAYEPWEFILEILSIYNQV